MFVLFCVLQAFGSLEVPTPEAVVDAQPAPQVELMPFEPMDESIAEVRLTSEDFPKAWSTSP